MLVEEFGEKVIGQLIDFGREAVNYQNRKHSFSVKNCFRLAHYAFAYGVVLS
jgi:hypothetical protein